MQDFITVSQFNNYVKNIFDNEEMLHNIPLLGEVYGVSFSRNVIYFSLKDESSSLPCVCFYPALASEIVEGAKLICNGSPNFYSKAGKLNFNVNRVEKLGQGKLYEEFLKLKEKLEKEGLFDSARKKAIPKNIKRIGVITSSEGAVIQDIKNVAWRRNPFVDIVLYNTKVQGLNAEIEIANAINQMSKYDKIDVIVVARGGGSMEDLSAYNTEIVARATYNCQKPIVSAVGHETDFTIIDFVADLRAPTPSAAAELLTTDMSTQKNIFENLKSKFNLELNNFVDERKSILYNILDFSYKAVEKQILNKKMIYNKLLTQFKNSSENALNLKSYDLGIVENTLSKINPSQILQKGYAKVEQNNKTINLKKEIDYQNNLSIYFFDGKINAMPIKEKNDENK